MEEGEKASGACGVVCQDPVFVCPPNACVSLHRHHGGHAGRAVYRDLRGAVSGTFPGAGSSMLVFLSFPSESVRFRQLAIRRRWGGAVLFEEQ